MTTPTTVQARFQLRADTAANWASVNPTLLNNEFAFETDTKKLKVGNGSTAWNSLAYFPSIVTGGTVLGNLEIGTTGTLTFEGSTADGFETTLAVTDPTADRTITLPNQSGTVVVSGNASIVDADIAANAEIAVSKLADGTARQLLQTDAAGTGVEWTDNVDIPGTLDVTGAATFDSSLAVTGSLTQGGNAVVTVGDSGTVTSTMIADGTIVNDDVNASAAIAGTKISPDFGSQTVQTTGIVSHALGSASAPTVTFTGDTNTGIFSPAADEVALTTAGSERARLDASGRLLIGTSSGSGGQYLKVQGITTNANSGAIITIARGNNPAAAGNGLGTLSFRQGTTEEIGAEITAESDASWTASSSLPTRIVFSTVASGSTTLTERIRIKSDGTLNISNLAVYADNASAVAGGLAAGDVYRNATGVLRVRY